tara:strand:+ start:4198 stop:5739 length:1542 start_codon:yes stop_codon:yes gene_type:complete
MDREEPAPDTSAQPSLIQLEKQVVDNTQEIDSDVLRPVVFSADNLFCRFELEPKGFLSSGSTISFSVTPPAGITRGFFPTNIGISSLISRAVLRTSSGRILSDMEEFGHFQSLKSVSLPSDTQKQRKQYSDGRCLDFGMEYVATDDNQSQMTDARYYGLQNGKEYTQGAIGGGWTDKGADRTGLTHHNFQVVAPDADRKDLSPSYSIPLYELFPFLESSNHLPLFAMGSDRVQIELTFTQTTNRRLSLDKDGDTAGEQDAVVLIDQNSVELMSDHIFYPGRMDAMKEEATKEGFQYNDFVLSRQTVTSSATPADDNSKSNVRQVGGAGRTVLRAFAGYVPVERSNGAGSDPPGEKSELQIMNNYKARSMNKTGNAVGKLESNLFYNERFLYPQTVTNSARQFHQLSDAERKQLYIPREVYSKGGDALAPDASVGLLYEGRGQTGNLAGHLFWQGWRLNRGERVGTKGIQLHMNALDNAGTGIGLTAGTYLQFCYLEVVRRATFNDGQVEVFFV